MSKSSRLFIFFYGVSLSYCYAGNESLLSVQESASAQKITSTSYADLAREYQQKADFYKAMAGIYESSTPQLSSLSSNESIPKIKKYNPLKGTQLSLGGGGTTGNSSSSNAQGNLVINYKPSESDVGWNFNTLGQYNYLYSDGNGVEKNRLYLQQNGYYMFDKFNGAFAQASYLNDITDGYYYTWNENIGYQLQLFKSDSQNLLLSLGPGLQQRQVVVSNGPSSQIKPSWLTQFTYNLNFTNMITFTEQLQNVATQLNNTTYSISSITIQAYRNIGIGFNYQFTFNSSPEPGFARLSTISGVTFVYSVD